MDALTAALRNEIAQSMITDSDLRDNAERLLSVATKLEKDPDPRIKQHATMIRSVVEEAKRE